MIGGLLVNGVNHLFGWQDEAKVARDRSRRVQIYWDPEEIVIRADRQVVGHHADGRGDDRSILEGALQLDGLQGSQESRQVTGEELSQDRLLSLAFVHVRDVFSKL